MNSIDERLRDTAASHGCTTSEEFRTWCEEYGGSALREMCDEGILQFSGKLVSHVSFAAFQKQRRGTGVLHSPIQSMLSLREPAVECAVTENLLSSVEEETSIELLPVAPTSSNPLVCDDHVSGMDVASALVDTRAERHERDTKKGATSRRYTVSATGAQNEAAERWLLWESLLSPRLGCWLLAMMTAFVMVPARAGIGSDELDWSYFVFECVVDLAFVVLIMIEFVSPREAGGHQITDAGECARTYFASEFVYDAVAVFPLQAILGPLYLSGSLSRAAAFDFCRINRMLLLRRFFVDFDRFALRLLPNLHPLLLRIIKFALIVIVYALIIAVPMHMVIRADGDLGAKWLNDGGGGSGSPGLEYTKTAWVALGIAAGRSFSRPRTENQVIVMSFVCLCCLGSMAFIIAGVDAMIITFLEQTSRLSLRLDETIEQMSRMKLPRSFVDEACSYYRSMHDLYKTFDYRTDQDFVEELPSDLRHALKQAISASTVRSIPLFAHLTDDNEFVEKMAGKLVLYLLVPGTVILTEGEEGHEMFFIEKGTAAVVDSEGQEVAVLAAGSFFGEQSVLMGTPRSHGVVAKTLCCVFMLTEEDFHDVAVSHPQAFVHIQRLSAQRRSQST